MANTYTKLDTYTVGSGGSSSITFSNIPQTHTDLHIKVSARNSGSGIGTFRMYFNGDASQAYTVIYAQGAGTATNAQAIVNASGGNNQTGLLSGTSTVASSFSNNDIIIPNYSSQLTKSWYSDGGEGENSTTAYLRLTGGNAYTGNSITSITLVPDTASFAQYSTFTLYGVWNNGTYGGSPSTPTIGTATDLGTAGQASITYTPSSGAASYTMISTPGSITATGTSSPIVVSGLTSGTAYTFTCQANNPFGYSSSSAASNSVTITSQYNSIATTSYSSGSGGDVTFYNIPNIYRHLQVRMFLRDTRAASDSTWFMQFNADTGNNYSYQGMQANGSSISALTSTTTNSFQGITSASSTGASRFGAAVIDIFDANQSNKYKTATYQTGYTNNGSGSIYTVSATWRSAYPITTITIKPNTGFAQYSHFALYGIG